jgi:hypothetical protein
MGTSASRASLLQEGFRNATVRTITPGRSLVSSKSDFDELIRPTLVEEISPEQSGSVPVARAQSQGGVADRRHQGLAVRGRAFRRLRARPRFASASGSPFHRLPCPAARLQLASSAAIGCSRRSPAAERGDGAPVCEFVRGSRYGVASPKAFRTGSGRRTSTWPAAGNGKRVPRRGPVHRQASACAGLARNGG